MPAARPTLAKERARSRSRRAQPAAAGGSRAAPKGHERGLEPGTADPQRRLEQGDHGRYAGCDLREACLSTPQPLRHRVGDHAVSRLTPPARPAGQPRPESTALLSALGSLVR
jgi:hypothetical protein